MAQWVGTTSESGILRKNKPKDNHDDLFVFGYACKLFRDDEKAQYIDQGKHLIPWMGDDNLKIDRYDGRGALSDIKPYEASREGYDAMRWLGLNESERKIEQLCDKERYYALEINEEEEKMYREEEEKRQRANQFQYSYDVPEQPTQQQQQQEIGPTARDNNDDDGDGGGVFMPPPQLDIPVDIEIPTTVKENARIEKTASFVHKQGPQMEILIKAKQADNPQFGFLNQGHRLYKYYRHILSAIKNGLYQVNSTISNKNDTKKDEDNADNNTNDDHYLHPSLLSTTTVNVDDHVDDVHVDVQTSSIPTLPYKPSANCAYSQLVNRIQGSLNEQQQQQQQLIQTTTTMIDNKNVQIYGVPPKNQEAYSQLTYEQQQYYQYYYIAQYYEYYKQLAQYQQNGGQQVQPPEMHLDPSIQNYIQQMAYTQYLQQQQQQTTNPYAQIVNNLSNLTNLQQQQQESSTTTTIEETRIVTNLSPKQQIKDDTEFKKPLLSLAQYGSDSDNDNIDNTDIDNNDNYKIPIGEIRIVIDKMASYVAKNGKQFEEIVKAKGDPRFEFLNETHDYYQYYRNKIKESTNNNSNSNNNNNGDKREVKIVPIAPQKLKENRKIIAPVSFSIKKPKDDGPKEIKSALPIEESDDETTIENQVIIEKNDDHLNNTVIPTIPIEINNSSNNNSSSSSNNSNNNNNNNNDSEGGNNGGIFDTDDPILEMIDLTDDLDDQKRDIKRAEDKIKDKLAMAAREKLVSVNRDNRALQLERKRKAAAFLALKSAENQTITNDENIIKSTPNISGGGGGGGSRVADLQQPIKDRSSDDNDDDLDDCGGDNGDQDGDNRRFQRKKKSHKRKHSKSKHDSKSRKKSKKKRRRSSSDTSTNSRSS